MPQQSELLAKMRQLRPDNFYSRLALHFGKFIEK